MSGTVELDPGACWIRHVKRGAGTTVLAATFAAQPLQGVNGRQGWQQAQPEVRLSDDGSLSVTFPNAAGEDGVLHRDRFALLTDPTYRAGEEWIEVWREPSDLIIVATPTRYSLDRSTLTIDGPDAIVLTRNAYSSEIDVWAGAAPLDVLAFYSSLPVARFSRDLTTGTAGLDTIDASATQTADGVQVSAASAGFADLGKAVAGAGNDWIAEARIRWVSRTDTGSRVRIFGGYVGGSITAAGFWEFALRPRSAQGYIAIGLGGAGGQRLINFSCDAPIPGVYVLRVVSRGEWLSCFVNGELVVRIRRNVIGPAVNVQAGIGGGVAVVQAMRFVSVEPFLMRDAPTDLRLPGVPPAGGLRARYYLEGTARLAGAGEYRLQALDPLADPYAERLEVPDFGGSVAANPTFQPAGPPNGEAFSVRWTGAIYLDLAATDRTASFGMGNEQFGRGRVWIAGKLVLDFSSAGGGAPTIAGPVNLRALLGNLAGWYPICVEFSHLTGNGGFSLYDSPVPGAAAPIAASRLSPLGTVDRQVRNEVSRDVFGDVADSFGYQWRLEPRSLESGRFPGQITAAARVGRDTAVVIDDLDAFDVAVQGDAGDSVDGLLADASGLATLADGADVSYEAFADLATSHLMYASGYESLSEISEETLLRARVESLLDLRAGVAETVGARTKGTRELVDRFPLPVTPDLARMLWLPGDGIRLELADVGVLDQSTRQLTIIQWACRPDGAAPPVVSYRQRARGARAALERLSRAAYQPQRYYQGQLALIAGGIATNFAGTTYGDGYSRLSLPAVTDVIKLELVVLSKTDASAWTVNINGVSTGLTVARAGRYDLTRFLALDVDAARVYCNLTGGAAQYEFQLVATVRI